MVTDGLDSSHTIIVLSDGESDDDIAFVGAARVGNSSPQFVGEYRSTVIEVLDITDDELDVLPPPVDLEEFPTPSSPLFDSHTRSPTRSLSPAIRIEPPSSRGPDEFGFTTSTPLSPILDSYTRSRTCSLSPAVRIEPPSSRGPDETGFTTSAPRSPLVDSPTRSLSRSPSLAARQEPASSEGSHRPSLNPLGLASSITARVRNCTESGV